MKKSIISANTILLAFFIYYSIVMVSFHSYIVFRKDLLSAIGMSLIIGFILNTIKDERFISNVVKKDYWKSNWKQILRFYIVPFCVSSFSALGPRIGGFYLIYPIKWT